MLEGAQLAHFLSARCGKLTASKAADAFAALKKGGWAASRGNLIREILAERLTGDSMTHYVSPEMRWGLDQEDAGKEEFQADTGIILTPCGVIDHPSIENFAATPDALIGADRVFELKCPTTTTFVAWRMAGVVPEEHVYQMDVQLACTRRRAAVFCAFDPRIKVGPKLFIRDYEPPAERIARVEEMAREFLAEVDRAWEILTTGGAR